MNSCHNLPLLTLCLALKYFFFFFLQGTNSCLVSCMPPTSLNSSSSSYNQFIFIILVLNQSEVNYHFSHTCYVKKCIGSRKERKKGLNYVEEEMQPSRYKSYIAPSLNDEKLQMPSYL